MLTWSENCLITTNLTVARKFVIKDTKICAPIITLSTQDNEKLLQQLKSVFK